MELIVKGETPVWDKDQKGWVAKDSVKAEENSKLDTELTMGVENVKSTIKAAEPVSEQVSVTSEDDEDDLPF